MECYIDHAKSLTIPKMVFNMLLLNVGGIGKKTEPVSITNFSIANGEPGITWATLEKEQKIISHGIHFDINKSVLKPESAGTINAIVKLMNEHPELKIEIASHTDSDGEDAVNQKLSQDRAGAVKKVTDKGSGVGVGKVVHSGNPRWRHRFPTPFAPIR